MNIIPYFNFITKFNIYEYIEDNLNNSRDKYFTGIDKKVAENDNNYLLDLTGGILTTDLKYLSKDSDNFIIFIPVFILHTGNTQIISGDNLFSGLNIKKDFLGYIQYLSGGNNYAFLGETIKKGGTKIENNLFFGNLYLYCAMSNIGWIDAYYYDRYIEHNKNEIKNTEQKINGQYVCDINENIGEYKCCKVNFFGYCTQRGTCQACNCEKKGEYKICKTETDNTINIDGKTCENTDNKCIDYYTGTINLNNTNCTLTGLEGKDDKKYNFLIR